MDELLIARYIRKITKTGIPKLMAKEIVETAYETCNGKNIEMYINYALNLVYGFHLLQTKRAKQ